MQGRDRRGGVTSKKHFFSGMSKCVVQGLDHGIVSTIALVDGRDVKEGRRSRMEGRFMKDGRFTKEVREVSG